MNNHLAKIFIHSVGYSVVCLSLLFGSLIAQESKMVAFMLQEAGEDLTKLEKLISDHENLLNSYPGSDFAPTLMFQLAELNQQHSLLIYQKAMAEYDAALDQYEKGETTREPLMPHLKMSKTLEYCQKLLTQYSRLSYRDKVLYMAAMAFVQEGNLAAAKPLFEEIIAKHPQSNAYLEAHFRIGEYHFDQREYVLAISYYKALLGKWDNPFFDMALYKLGWSYFNLTDYKNAISTFIFLIEDINLLERTKSPLFSKSRADLRSEAIQYVSSSFTEYGGAEAAREFLQNYKEKDYTISILSGMGELYQKRNYYTEAIATYQVFLQFYPFHNHAPHIYRQIITNYELDEKMVEANAVRELVVTKFGPGGPWLMQYPDGEGYHQGLALAREMLLYLGTFYQEAAQKNERIRDYQLAIAKYREFLEKFSKESDAARVNYYLADCYFSIKDYNSAAQAYHDVVTKYPDSPFREEAGYNRILSYFELLSNEKPGDSLSVAINDFIATGEPLTINVARLCEKNGLLSCNDFVLLFPESKLLDQVYMKYGEILHQLAAYLPAVQVYRRVMALGKDRPYYLSAAMNAGQCYFDGAYYSDANSWFGTIAVSFPDSTAHAAKARTLAASANFKIAESLSASGKNLEAATLLLSIANQNDDPIFRERALFEAGHQYQKIGDNMQAAITFEGMANSYPQSELADEALYKAAGLREADQEWHLAAGNYLKLTESYPQSEFAMRALRNAAICYETLQDWTTARSLYERFATQFSGNGEELLEALYKTGEMYFRSDNDAAATSAFQKTVQKYNELVRTAAAVENYFAAQAQFMIGEILFEDFKKIVLTPPLNTALKRKVAQSNQVFKAYMDALAYQVSDWSTAASHRIGMTFEEFVRAFLESPRPSGMTDEQLKLYNEKLAEFARPYKEKALETYQRNVEQAETFKVNNSWVDESRKRITALIAELRLGGNLSLSTSQGSKE